VADKLDGGKSVVQHSSIMQRRNQAEPVQQQRKQGQQYVQSTPPHRPSPSPQYSSRAAVSSSSSSSGKNSSAIMTPRGQSAIRKPPAAPVNTFSGRLEWLWCDKPRSSGRGVNAGGVLKSSGQVFFDSQVNATAFNYFGTFALLLLAFIASYLLRCI